MSGLGIDPSGALAAAGTPDQETARLRKAAQQLEGVFVEHLFKAMRATVPEGGVVDGGSGEEIFNSLLDQHFADGVAFGWERGLGAAIYRQLRASVTDDTAPVDTSPQLERGE